MYAVIKTGGKQYKVQQDELLRIEKIEASIGDSVNFPVLLYKEKESAVEIDTSKLSYINVQATVVNQIRGDKIKIIKFRRRKHHRKQMGHRQYYTLIKINDIGRIEQNGS